MHGQDGMLRAEKTSLKALSKLPPSPGFVATLLSISFLERYEAAYLSEIRAFVAAATGGSDSYPGILDGLRAADNGRRRHLIPRKRSAC